VPIPETGFIKNVNTVADKIAVIESANQIFDEGVVTVLQEIALLDLDEAIQDLKKGNYLGNRKLDINLALNMIGITEDLLVSDPDAAEAIWVDTAKAVHYSGATITFNDGVIVSLPFIFDGSPTTVSTHGDLITQLSRYDLTNAVRQVATISDVVAIDSTTYTVTINGTVLTYISDVSATAAEIITGLVNAINLNPVPVTAVAAGTTFTLSADVVGTAFTAAVDGNMTLTATVPNGESVIAETAFIAKMEDTILASFATNVVGEIIRAYDVVGQNSNLERIQLHAVSGAFSDPNPIYYWAKTTSAFQTLSMRAGDIIKLGNDIDSIITLATRITEMLDLQNKMPQLVTNVDSLYTNIAKLVAIYDFLMGLNTIYDDIKVGGTNYINTVALDLNLIDSKIAIVAADLQLGNLSKIKIVKDSITGVNTVAANITNVNTAASNIVSVNTVAPSIASVVTTASSIANVNTVATNIASVNTNAANIVAIQNASTNAATATTQAGIATTQAGIATTQASNSATSASTATTQAGISTTQAGIATTQAGVATTQAGIATAKANSILGLTTQATTGAAGSMATVSYNSIDGKMTFSIPQGIQGIRGEAFTVNSVGLAADRALYDAQIKGFSFLAIDVGLVYFKLSNTSADWSIGAPFGKGDQGDTGPTGIGITSIAFLSTTHVSGLAAMPGGTDTYRITLSDTSTYNFLLYNGLNGVLINDATLSLVATWSSQKSSDQLALKAPVNNPTFTGTVAGVTAAMVGLGNVDNTSDVSKPVSTAQATAIGLKIDTAAKDATGGVPGLTLFKLNMRNAANTITSWFTNAATVARTWTLPDKDGTVAMLSDITGTNSGTNTGDQTSIVGITGTIAQFNTAVTDADFASLAGSETLTNKTLTSPTLTTPALGTPASGDLSGCTADGTNAVGFRHIPQNSKSAAYTLVLSDAGKHILHPSADTTARIFTIPANASVAFPIGTAVTFVNQASGGVITIAITTDTMRLAGAGTTGSRTLAANGVATAVKLTSTEWIISGTNLT
jgi:hypothetical protein